MVEKNKLYLVLQTRNSDFKIIAIAYAVDDEAPAIFNGKEEYLLSQFNDLVKQLKKDGFRVITCTEDLKSLLYEKANNYDYRSTREWTKTGEVITVGEPLTPLKGSLSNREQIYNQCVKKLEELRKQFKNKL